MKNNIALSIFIVAYIVILAGCGGGSKFVKIEPEPELNNAITSKPIVVDSSMNDKKNIATDNSLEEIKQNTQKPKDEITQQQPETVVKIEISGSVKNKEGKLLPNSRIRAIPVDPQDSEIVAVGDITDENGKYKIQLIPFNYKIEVICDNHEGLIVEEKLYNKNISNLDFELVALVPILIQLFDTDGKTSITDASIRINDKTNEKNIREAILGEDNNFHVNVPLGSYTISASKDEDKYASGDIEITNYDVEMIIVQITLLKKTEGPTRTGKDKTVKGSVETN